MYTYNLIAAFDLNYVVGVNGEIPWKCPMDMRRFKKLTVGSTVIMGRLTWDSLPIKPLPNRTNVVVSSTMRNDKRCLIVKTFDAAIELARMHSKQIFFIGGNRIWKECASFCDNFYLTVIKTKVLADKNDDVVTFPKINYLIDIIDRKWYTDEVTVGGEKFNVGILTGVSKHGCR